MEIAKVSIRPEAAVHCVATGVRNAPAAVELVPGRNVQLPFGRRMTGPADIAFG
jgi:hypothetical protein